MKTLDERITFDYLLDQMLWIFMGVVGSSHKEEVQKYIALKDQAGELLSKEAKTDVRRT